MTQNATDHSTPSGRPAGSQSQGRRRIAIAVAVVVLCIAAVATVVVAFGGSSSGKKSSGSTRSAASSGSTVTVQTGTLLATEQITGSAGFDNAATTLATGTGTVTRIVPAGSTVERGGKLIEVNGGWVRLLYGSRPMWRTLSSSVTSGSDVKQLEQNLKALGYTDGGSMTVDGTWTSATTVALEAWQTAVGMTVDGSLAVGDVLFLPGAQRIGTAPASAVVGAILQPGTAMLATTGDAPVVTVSVDADMRSRIKLGEHVTLSWPGGELTNGRISTLGDVTSAAASTGSTSGGVSSSSSSTTPTATITVTPIGKVPTGSTFASVDVGLARDRTPNVLMVTSTALVATGRGTYAVERASDGKRLPVSVGSFGNGMVSISGTDIVNGLKVVDAQ